MTANETVETEVVIDPEETDIPVREAWTFSIPKPRLPKLHLPSKKTVAVAALSSAIGAAAVVLAGMEKEDEDGVEIQRLEIEMRPLEEGEEPVILTSGDLTTDQD